MATDTAVYIGPSILDLVAERRRGQTHVEADRAGLIDPRIECELGSRVASGACTPSRTIHETHRARSTCAVTGKGDGASTAVSRVLRDVASRASVAARSFIIPCRFPACGVHQFTRPEARP